MSNLAIIIYLIGFILCFSGIIFITAWGKINRPDEYEGGFSNCWALFLCISWPIWFTLFLPIMVLEILMTSLINLVIRFIKKYS